MHQNQSQNISSTCYVLMNIDWWFSSDQHFSCLRHCNVREAIAICMMHSKGEEILQYQYAGYTWCKFRQLHESVRCSRDQSIFGNGFKIPRGLLWFAYPFWILLDRWDVRSNASILPRGISSQGVAWTVVSWVMRCSWIVLAKLFPTGGFWEYTVSCQAWLQDLCELSIYGFCVRCLGFCFFLVGFDSHLIVFGRLWFLVLSLATTMPSCHTAARPGYLGLQLQDVCLVKSCHVWFKNSGILLL